ncbi:MAG: phosphotransferase [Oscillospiraceae bacterium]|nr:phosphotransferase [Oscillospiraceae bacterium]
MKYIESKIENGRATIYLIGNVDSSNAAAVEAEVNEAKGDAKSVTVDCGRLNYISSAGLRIILRLKKAVGDVEVINVSSDVYEVFEMTGFTEMMDIKKAFRRISVEGCDVIGTGANGKVFRIDPDTIVKVYYKGDALEEINRERELARTAFVLGVPTAIPYDVVQVEGGYYGSVFELLSAKSYQDYLLSGEKTPEEIAKMGVEVLKTVHSTELTKGSLPRMDELCVERAEKIAKYLDKESGDKFIALAKALKPDFHMLHGDFHIKNVMVQNGESLLIDMDTLAVGDPVFEFAGIYLAYIGYAELDKNNPKEFFKLDYSVTSRIWEETFKEYFAGKSEDVLARNLDRIVLLANGRMIRHSAKHIDEEEIEKARFERAVQNVTELLKKVDSLPLE